MERFWIRFILHQKLFVDRAGQTLHHHHDSYSDDDDGDDGGGGDDDDKYHHPSHPGLHHHLGWGWRGNCVRRSSHPSLPAARFLLFFTILQNSGFHAIMLWCAICALQCFVVQVDLSLFQAFYPSLYLHRVAQIVQDIVQGLRWSEVWYVAGCEVAMDGKATWDNQHSFSEVYLLIVALLL